MHRASPRAHRYVCPVAHACGAACGMLLWTQIHELRAKFLAADKDKSGQLCLTEFRSALTGLVSPEAAEALFDAADRDDNSTVAYVTNTTSRAPASQTPRAMTV